MILDCVSVGLELFSSGLMVLRLCWDDLEMFWSVLGQFWMVLGCSGMVLGLCGNGFVVVLGWLCNSSCCFIASRVSLSYIWSRCHPLFSYKKEP